MTNGGDSDHHMESTPHLTRHEIVNLFPELFYHQDHKIVPSQFPQKRPRD